MIDDVADEDGVREQRAEGAQTVRLRTLQTAMAEAETALARRLGINLTDLGAMTHLAFADQPLGPGELSGRLGITPGATTELVDRLERSGHLERRRDVADRRRVRLHPTDAAIQRVSTELRPLIGALDDIASRLSGDERDVVGRYLTDVLDAYRAFADGPPART